MTIFTEPDGATPLDPDEIADLKLDHMTTRAELNEVEQANIEQGLVWLSRQRRGDVVTDEFLRLLHNKMFGDVWNWAGTYRLTEKNIGIDPIHISVQTRILIDDAKYWSGNNIFPPLEAAARYHHRLVQIHLFPNGNGRHARIAADAFLERYYGHPPIEWNANLDIQENNARRSAYISALRAADCGEFDALLAFVGQHP